MNKLFFLLLSLQVFLITGCGAVEDKNGDIVMKKEKASDKTHFHIIGDNPEANEVLGKALNEPDEAWDLIHEGSRHYRNKEYDLAISKLKRALEIPGGDEWVARSRLGEVYEAKDEYVLALEQINWQLSLKPREENPEFVDSLVARKQRLEKLLAQKSQ